MKAQTDLTGVSDIGITNHALGKLRERLPPSSIWLHACDSDVRNMLRQAWNTARTERKVALWWEDIEGKVLLNHVFDLLETDLALVALVREDDRTPGRPAYISVLTKSMVERSQRLGHWATSKGGLGKVRPGPIPAFKNTALRDQLSGVRPAAPFEDNDRPAGYGLRPLEPPPRAKREATSLLDSLQEGLDTTHQEGIRALSPPAPLPILPPHPGKLLRAWLLQEKMRVTDAAKKMGIPQPALSHIMHRGTASADVRERIAELTSGAIPAGVWGPPTKQGRPVGAKDKHDRFPALTENPQQAPNGSVLDRLERCTSMPWTSVPVPAADLRAVLDFVTIAREKGGSRRVCCEGREPCSFHTLLRAIEETPEQTKQRKQEAFQKKLEAFKLMTPEQKMQQTLATLAERGESIEDFFKRLTAPVEE